MTALPRGRYDFALKRKNLIALLAMCVVLCTMLVIRAGARRVRIGRDVRVFPQRLRAATERIDPNVATTASLRRLPGIGPTMARRIVDYRQRSAAPAFRTAEDLKRVKGIGPRTVERIGRHLAFGDPRRLSKGSAAQTH